MGLRTKILVTIVGPLAILLAVFVVNDLRSSRTEALDAASSALEDRVRIAATQLEGLLLRMSQVSETTSIAVRDQDEWPDEDLQQLSRSLVATDPDIFGVAIGWIEDGMPYLVVHRDGDVLVEFEADIDEVSGLPPLLERLLTEGDAFWASPHDAVTLSGFDAAAHLVPIGDREDPAGGVAVIIDPASFRRLAARIGLDDSPWLIMADDGTVVASSEETAIRMTGDSSIRGLNLFRILEEQGVSDSELQLLRENLHDRDVFVQISDQAGTGRAPQVAAMARLKGTPWFLVTGEPIEQIVGPVVQLVAERAVADAFLIVAAVVIVQVGAWFTVIRPIRRIVGVVDEAAAGRRGVRADLPGRDEIAMLGRTIDDALPRLDELAATRAAMANARLVQESLIPQAPCEGRGITVAGRIEACDETGGDYFEHASVDDDRTYFTLGDATGHGMPAAILLATARAYLRSAVRRGEPMRAAVAEANDRLVEDSPPGLFMVVVHACFDPDRRSVEIVSAGQPAFVLRRGGQGFETIEATGIPLGIAPTTYESHVLEDVSPGDVVLMASDGAWEVRDEQGEMLGIDALLERAKQVADRSPVDQVAALFDFVHAFAGERPLEDDCTILIARIEDR